MISGQELVKEEPYHHNQAMFKLLMLAPFFILFLACSEKKPVESTDLLTIEQVLEEKDWLFFAQNNFLENAGRWEEEYPGITLLAALKFKELYILPLYETMLIKSIEYGDERFSDFANSLLIDYFWFLEDWESITKLLPKEDSLNAVSSYLLGDINKERKVALWILNNSNNVKSDDLIRIFKRKNSDLEIVLTELYSEKLSKKPQGVPSILFFLIESIGYLPDTFLLKNPVLLQSVSSKAIHSLFSDLRSSSSLSEDELKKLFILWQYQNDLLKFNYDVLSDLWPNDETVELESELFYKLFPPIFLKNHEIAVRWLIDNNERLKGVIPFKITENMRFRTFSSDKNDILSDLLEMCSDHLDDFSRYALTFLYKVDNVGFSETVNTETKDVFSFLRFSEFKFSDDRDSEVSQFLYLTELFNLEEILIDFRSDFPVSKQEARILTKKLQNEGRYYDSVVYFSDFFYDNGLNRKDLKLYYPAPFKSIVEKTGKSLNISDYWIYAVIRTESAFNTNIKSSAGARGLMQLLSSTAREQADLLHINQFDLKNPEDNILLGSAYFKRQWVRFGHPVKAMMSYNAGGSNVRRWEKFQANRTPVFFTEAIPFRETRSYVRRVVYSALVYSYLLNDEVDEQILNYFTNW